MLTEVFAVVPRLVESVLFQIMGQHFQGADLQQGGCDEQPAPAQDTGEAQEADLAFRVLQTGQGVETLCRQQTVVVDPERANEGGEM